MRERGWHCDGIYLSRVAADNTDPPKLNVARFVAHLGRGQSAILDSRRALNGQEIQPRAKPSASTGLSTCLAKSSTSNRPVVFPPAKPAEKLSSFIQFSNATNG
jgi:hypothetical protein